MAHLGPRDVALLPAALPATRSRDVQYRYRQDSDFHYITGFPEPEALAILAPGHPRGSFWLLVRERDAAKEVWDGPRHGLEQARRLFRADVALPISELRQVLEELLGRASTLHHMPGRNEQVDAALRRAMNRRRRAGLGLPRHVQDLAPLVHEMRLRKDKGELAIMRRAAAITGKAHRSAMALAAPGMYEYQLEAHIEGLFRHQGAAGPAYPSIVGSAANGVVLHHIENRRRMRAGDLVLVDAGCELDGYASDVTRTFPVDGRFRPAQRRLYDLVLAAQQAAIARVRPGGTLMTVHKAAVEVLAAGLSRLGILPGTADEIVASGSYRRFYMHSTSHWLGLDVHDVGGRVKDGKLRRLSSGMVLTVEPGLYISADASDVAGEYRGIGIRIEDDILVTGAGRENLTGALPRSAAAVERACCRT